MYNLLNSGSLVQYARVCGVIISTYNYRHSEIHSCIRLKWKGAILNHSILYEFTNLLLVFKWNILYNSNIVLEFQTPKKILSRSKSKSAV